MKSFVASCALSTIAVLGFNVTAFAGSGENAGTIASLNTVGTPYGQWYEVTINGLGTLCPGHNFAYVGTADNNGTTEFNAMSYARQYGSNLYIFWTTDANGYCHITRLYY